MIHQSSLPARTPDRNELRASLFAFVLLVALKGGLLLFAAWSSSWTIYQIISGHDACEYFNYARHLANHTLGTLPLEARRHNPGWPLLLASVYRIALGAVEFPVLALGAGLACSAASIILFPKLLAQFPDSREPRNTTLSLPYLTGALALVAIGYPSQLYYGIFGLSEPLFGVLILGSLILAGAGKFGLAYMIASGASLVRAPGVLLFPAIFAADAWALYSQAKRGHSSRGSTIGFALRTAAGIVLAATPLGLWSTITARAWSSSYIQIYKPQMGLPFSGFAGIREVGTLRAVYVVFVVAVFGLSICRLAYLALTSKTISPASIALVCFSCLFFGFHICVTSLYYIDRVVWTFNYQDRYLVCLWPVAVLAWGRWLRPWLAGAAGAVSLALSAYWLHNYLQIAQPCAN